MNNVVTKAPGQPPRLEQWETLNLTAFQDEVDGWIEACMSGEHWIMFCNEEGKLAGLDYNFTLPNGDAVVGNVVVVGVDDDDDGIEERGLTDAEAIMVMRMFGEHKPKNEGVVT